MLFFYFRSNLLHTHTPHAPYFFFFCVLFHWRKALFQAMLLFSISCSQVPKFLFSPSCRTGLHFLWAFTLLLLFIIIIISIIIIIIITTRNLLLRSLSLLLSLLLSRLLLLYNQITRKQLTFC